MSLCFCLFSFRFIYSFSLTEFGSLFFDVSPLFFVYSFFSVSFTSSMLFSRSLIPLTNVKIVILFYLLSLLFYLISLMLFLFLFFPQSFFILSITLFLFFFYFLFSILFIWSLRIVIFVFLSSCPPAFFVLFYLPCPCFSLPLLPTHNFDFALCGPSRFGYDTTRPPRRDHSFATMLPVMNGIPSSLSRLYTYRLRTMGHNYINDNRVTNFTEYRKLVNF